MIIADILTMMKRYQAGGYKRIEGVQKVAYGFALNHLPTFGSEKTTKKVTQK